MIKYIERRQYETDKKNIIIIFSNMILTHKCERVIYNLRTLALLVERWKGSPYFFFRWGAGCMALACQQRKVCIELEEEGGGRHRRPQYESFKKRTKSSLLMAFFLLDSTIPACPCPSKLKKGNRRCGKNSEFSSPGGDLCPTKYLH